MTSFDKQRWLRAGAMAWLVAAALSAASVGIAIADDAAGGGAGAAKPVPESSTPPAEGSFPAQPPPVEKRGLLNNFGRWWDQSFADFNAKLKAAREKIEDINTKQNESSKDAATAAKEAVKKAADAAKDAATAVVRLPNTRVLELGDRCEVAANGAPDCRAAATNACRKKGFDSGQPIDIRTSQECPPAVLFSGRPPAEGECPEETVILRAICQ
jgi:hypothetical protein